MSLDKITTEELQAELKRRKIDKTISEDDVSFPHLFLYSKTLNEFDTELMLVPSPKELQLMPLMLRCRYNSHRDLRIYSIKLTEEDGRLFNEALKDESRQQEIFEKMEKALIELPI